MFFYLSSHGIVDHPGAALGLLEDVNSDQFAPWCHSFNVTTLASSLPAIGVEQSWVFLDACQERLQSVTDLVNGTEGLSLITPKASQLVRNKARTFALVGSYYGRDAEAPRTAEPPYFTQALLKGLKSCVELDENGANWIVTSKQLQYELPKVAEAAYGYTCLPVQQLVCCSAVNHSLLRIANPMVPVVVRTNPISDLQNAVRVTASATNKHGTVYASSGKGITWQFEVPADYNEKYDVVIEFPSGGRKCGQKSFYAHPAAQIVELK